MGLKTYMLDVARAIGFLSRIPVPARYFEDYDGSLVRPARAFPLAGALIVLPAALCLALLISFDASPELAALLALGLQILLTGALHEDGFADCADGLGGGRDRTRRLEIMKDSRLGAYGGVAIVFSIGIRTFALAQLSQSLSPWAVIAAMLGAASLARAAMVWHWTALPPAKTSGVASAAGMPDSTSRNGALVSGVLLFLLLCVPAYGIYAALSGIFIAIIGSGGFIRLTRGKIEGHTGDTLGAAEQIAEIAALTALALAS